MNKAPWTAMGAMQMLAMIDAALTTAPEPACNASTKRRRNHTKTSPAGFTILQEFVAWIALQCQEGECIRYMYAAQEVLEEVLHRRINDGQHGCEVQWRPTVILRKHKHTWDDCNYRVKTEADLTEDQILELGIKNPEHWMYATWHTTFESETCAGNDEHTLRLIAEMEANLAQPLPEK